MTALATLTHGTRHAYNQGCRCGPCRDAERAYRTRFRAAAAGRGSLKTRSLLVGSADTTWMEHAACASRGHHDFFSWAQDATDRALDVCDGCPVQAECLRYALMTRQEDGVWGGTTEADRRAIWRAARQQGLVTSGYSAVATPDPFTDTEVVERQEPTT